MDGKAGAGLGAAYYTAKLDAVLLSQAVRVSLYELLIYLVRLVPSHRCHVAQLPNRVQTDYRYTSVQAGLRR